MKRGTPVRAPSAGRVREVLAAVNAQVDAGAPLLRLDRAGDDAAASPGHRLGPPRARGDRGAAGARAAAGAPLLRLARAGDDAAASTGERIVLPLARDDDGGPRSA